MMARRLTLWAALSAAVTLGGCASSSDMVDKLQEQVADFNPFGTAKKPLPGERKALFPEGVPGVQQGVPPELVRGAQPEAVAAVPEPAPEAKPRAKPRRVRTAAPVQAKPVRRARAPQAAPSNEPPADGVWPPPEPQAAAPRRAAPASAPASAPSQTVWPTPAQPAPTAWPDPPPAR